MLVTPDSRAAASNASVPLVRSRFVAAKLRSKCLKSLRPASAVAWWTIASGRASAIAARDGSGIEQIEHDRLRTEPAQPTGLLG